MDFFWPEKYKRAEDVNVDEMFKIVEKKRESLLENLDGISPQMTKSPIDLLTIYAIYDVFSLKWEMWEETRKWFVDRYKNRLRYYIKNENSLPEYRSFVRRLFYDLFDMKLKNEIKQMDLDSYFVENKGERLISSTGVLWEEIKSWTDFQDVLVKMCRELFPYAERRFDNIFYSKNFKNEILDLFFKKKKEEILWILSESIAEYGKLVDESKEEQMNNLKKQIEEQWESRELLAMLDLIENWEWKIFLEIDGMVKVLSVFDVEDYDIRWEFIRFYIDEVVERFRNSSDKRDPIRKLQSKQTDIPKKNKSIEVWIEKDVNLWKVISRISAEDDAIIDSIVQTCNLDKKNWKVLKKYLERILVNWKNCRMSSLNKFWITMIDDTLQGLFNDLWVLLEYDVLDKEESPSENTEDLALSEDNDNVEEVVEEDVCAIEDAEPCEECFDLFAIVLEQIKKHNYKIFNERRLEKQVEELCSTDDELKKVLWVELKKDSFWNPKKKHGRNYYTIEIAVTWLRFILFKCKDGSFIIDWLYNHNDYDKRVKEL